MPARIASLGTAMASVLLAGCLATSAPEPSSEPAPQAKAAGLANPASVHCVESGGRLRMERDASGGEYGLCALPGGSTCEEWALFRGECGPARDVKR